MSPTPAGIGATGATKLELARRRLLRSRDSRRARPVDAAAAIAAAIDPFLLANGMSGPFHAAA